MQFEKQPRKRIKTKANMKNKSKLITVFKGVEDMETSLTLEKWEEWAKKEAKIRDNFTCVLCGSKENVEAHHHYRQGVNTKANNLLFKNLNKKEIIKRINLDWIVSLCRKCHFKTQSKFTDPYEQIKIDKEIENYLKEKGRLYKGEVITLEDLLSDFKADLNFKNFTKKIKKNI